MAHMLPRGARGELASGEIRSRPTMPAMSLPVAGTRIAFRCDGDDRVGAGHVARCLPLARAFAQLGCQVSFVGAYEGLAAWLLARADIDTRAPDPRAPCGLREDEHDAVVLDSYLIAPAAICETALSLPLVTIAEANRCPSRGILLDYHLDRNEPSSSRLLAGPSYAPLDPAFAGAGHPADEIRKVLVTVGGSTPARELLAELVLIVGSAFADAEILVAGGDYELETHSAISSRVASLPAPSALVDFVSDIDLVVTAAGLSAYEMACAGIPQVAIAIATNQRRVIRGLCERGLAPCLDLTSGDSPARLRGVLERLRDVTLRRRLAKRGMAHFDGRGARRAALALAELFAHAQETQFT
jgi:spore coat polysaccharide biosynthesis predicted glycosyltransferase SpsG